MASVTERACAARRTLSLYTRQTLHYTGEPKHPRYKDDVEEAIQAIQEYREYIDDINEQAMARIPLFFTQSEVMPCRPYQHEYDNKQYHFSPFLLSGVIMFKFVDISNPHKISANSELYRNIRNSMQPALDLCGFVKCDHNIYNLSNFFV